MCLLIMERNVSRDGGKKRDEWPVLELTGY